MIVVFLLITIVCAASGANFTIYSDSLQNGWQSWSWATVTLDNSSPKHSGSASIKVQSAADQALYLNKGSGSSVSLATYYALEFWIHGGSTGGQTLYIKFNPNSSPTSNSISLTPPTANQWTLVHIDFFPIYGGSTANIDEFWIQSSTATTFYVDDISFIQGTFTPPPPPPVSGPTIAVSVDTTKNIKAINPLIYGVNFADQSHFASLKYPINRQGGNAETAYNWEKGVSNRANDYYFENIPDDVSNVGALPEGTGLTKFVDTTKSNGAAILLTATTIGYAALDQRTKKCSYSVTKYGAQDKADGDCGNGRKSGVPITSNDRSDTYQVVNETYVTKEMQFLSTRGTPITYWSLDNEVDLWASTHFDKWGTTGISYDQLWQMTMKYAAAMKAQDPSIKIFGPVSWGFCGWFYSPKDDKCAPTGSDYTSHGSMDLLQWYAQQVNTYNKTHGVLLVDYLDVHYYPQQLNDDINPSLTSLDDDVNRRFRYKSLRSLYDPTFVDQSWIKDTARNVLQFIPYLHTTINTYCPSMKIAITEWNWGNDDIISAAVATAEALAIFGREGVDIATRWVVPAVGSRVENAFKMYLDYDGTGKTVNGNSVQATTSNVDLIGAYAIHSTSTNEVFVYLFNKYEYNNVSTQVTVTVANAPNGVVRLYGFDEYHSYQSKGTTNLVSNTFTVSTMYSSATLAVVSMTGGGGISGTSTGSSASTASTASSTDGAGSRVTSATHVQFIGTFTILLLVWISVMF